jgi:hypothetical protein
VDEVNTRMTAQVIHDVDADVQGGVEAEDRPSLDRFNQDLLGGRFSHVMLIDGNDTRGIDVGIMTTKQVEIVSMHSNVDAPDPGAAGEHLFSRDCIEYLCRLPSGKTVRVLLNHFKSQSGGGGEKPARQAKGVRKIADRLIAAGEKNLIVIGDLNEGPDGQGNPAKHFAPLYAPTSPSWTCPTFHLRPRAQAGDLSGLFDNQPAGLHLRVKAPSAQGPGGRDRTAWPLGESPDEETPQGVGHLPRDRNAGTGSVRPRRHLRRHQYLGADGDPLLEAG